MPPRPRRQAKRKTVPDIDAPPPWEPMDRNAETAARDAYLKLRARTGLPPVPMAGEKVLGARERIGANPRNVWSLVRFDPDRTLARRVLIGAVDFKRETLVENRKWIGVDPGDRPEPTPPADPPNQLLAPFSRHAIPSPARERLILLYPDSTVDEAAREFIARALTKLAEDAAKVGLLVTDESVVASTRPHEHAR